LEHHVERQKRYKNFPTDDTATYVPALHPMKIRKESVGLGKAPQIVMHTNLALCPEIGMIQFINIEMDITICIRTLEMP
jgi:hypothetical protein